MKNKKYLVSAGIAAAALAVGGTAAFFTSEDSITNPFTTGTTNEDGTGIDVIEDFRTLALEEDYSHPSFEVPFSNTNPSRGFEEYDNDDDDSTDLGDKYGELLSSTSGPVQMLPGELFVKQMRVDSTVNYDQYLRVMPTITITMMDEMPVVITLPSNLEDLVDSGALVVVGGSPIINYEGLIIELDPTVLTEWTAGSDGYFYYNSILVPGAHTNDIVKSVVIDPEAGNEWQNASVTIKLDAESIQATTDAWGSWAPVDVTRPE